MITGYQSQELNTQADKVYAEKYLQKMFEHVQHVWLRQVDVDVSTLPIDRERVLVTCGEAPVEQSGAKGVGGWDVWQQTQQAKHNENGAQGVREGKSGEEKVWVQVSAWDESGDESAEPATGETFRLRKIMGR